ncbi:MAG TPA: DUF502 domain-containing protein [Tepidisphaeraceae bacterium]|nr:DUF502 domain-containing protein [Tepidisphaeraceae bacterium]
MSLWTQCTGQNMADIKQHLRNKFLAGIFAAIPLAATGFVIWYVEMQTRTLFHLEIPFLGILLALAAIYLLGLIVTSLLGQWVLTRVDRLLGRIPGLRELYSAWKQIALNPPGSQGVYSKVVLVPDETGSMQTLGFTSGQPIAEGSEMLCVFVPASPNPTSGRLYFVPRAQCLLLDISIEDAFKMILSSGNYVAPALIPTPQQSTGQP